MGIWVVLGVYQDRGLIMNYWIALVDLSSGLLNKRLQTSINYSQGHQGVGFSKHVFN